MNEGRRVLADLQSEDVVDLVENIDQIVEDALPEDEREAYEAAQDSIVEARRNAENHEGLLQLH
jgi:hypothetical protein